MVVLVVAVASPASQKPSLGSAIGISASAPLRIKAKSVPECHCTPVSPHTTLMPTTGPWGTSPEWTRSLLTAHPWANSP